MRITWPTILIRFDNLERLRDKFKRENPINGYLVNHVFFPSVANRSHSSEPYISLLLKLTTVITFEKR